MEGVLWDIPNVLVYIYDLLVHTDTHVKHLQVLDQVMAWLHKYHLKINLKNVYSETRRCPTWASPSLQME